LLRGAYPISNPPKYPGRKKRKEEPFMAGKIFYRERSKMTDGAKQPRYILVAVSGVDLKVYGQHLRMCELKQIADGVGAELVALGRGEHHGTKEH
jgi:hypothetical protein